MSAQFVHLVIKLYKLWTWSVSLLHSRSNASLSLTYALRNCFCDPHTFIIRIPSTPSPSPLFPIKYGCAYVSLLCVCVWVCRCPAHAFVPTLQKHSPGRYNKIYTRMCTERNGTELNYSPLSTFAPNSHIFCYTPSLSPPLSAASVAIVCSCVWNFMYCL